MNHWSNCACDACEIHRAMGRSERKRKSDAFIAEFLIALIVACAVLFVLDVLGKWGL